MRVDSLLRATGRDARGVAQPWSQIEAELGTELPSDYKQLCQAFGVGEFSGAERRRPFVLLPAGRLGCAVLAGASAAAAWLTPRAYYEVTLLSGAAAFLVTAVVVCGLVDAWADVGQV
ncbi:SMI1/KNR4 family protein [Streptomyces sp. NPDC002076]